ncbi:MAG: hypothetical protein F4Y02_04510 [Chloroflexi bacterium]|nr:hypothetical protein [Chloroflexota bacterium]
MEPTLPDGCSILFDRNRRTPRDGRICVVRAGEGLIVKRAARRGRGWELASDNPAVEAGSWWPMRRRSARSCGRPQRAAIARVLAMRRHVMYFDEPTSALDPALGRGRCVRPCRSSRQTA